MEQHDGQINLQSDGDERARRDALARSLAARVCDDRIDADTLDVMHRVLSELVEPVDLVARLTIDRYNEEEGEERTYRRAWNAAMRHALALVIAEREGRRPVFACVAAEMRETTEAAPLPPAPAVSRTPAMDFDLTDEEPRR